jgi:hypothetical protein
LALIHLLFVPTIDLIKQGSQPACLAMDNTVTTNSEGSGLPQAVDTPQSFPGQRSQFSTYVILQFSNKLLIVAGSSQACIPPQPGSTSRVNSGIEGRFEIKEPARAETLRHVRPDAITEKFESGIKASIVYFHKLSLTDKHYIVRGTPSITQLLSKPGPAQYMASLPDYQYSKEEPKPDLIWIHLPANNMSWVEVIGVDQSVKSKVLTEL